MLIGQGVGLIAISMEFLSWVHLYMAGRRQAGLGADGAVWTARCMGWLRSHDVGGEQMLWCTSWIAVY